MLFRRHRSGFSLIELLLVVAIVGVFAALAVSQSETSVPRQLRAAAESLRVELDYARSLAIANNSTYQVAIDATAKNYSLSHTGTDTALDVLPTRTLDPQAAGSSVQTTHLNELRPLGTTGLAFHAIDTGGAAFLTSGAIEFGPHGETTNTNTTFVWLAGGDTPRRIYLAVSVDPITGAARIAEVQSQAPSPVNAL